MIRVCVFDAYGTLFDVAGAARLAAGEPGGGALAEAWPKLAEDWDIERIIRDFADATERMKDDDREQPAGRFSDGFHARGVAMTAFRTLRLILGDQLDTSHAWFSSVDSSVDLRNRTGFSPSRKLTSGCFNKPV